MTSMYHLGVPASAITAVKAVVVIARHPPLLGAGAGRHPAGTWPDAAVAGRARQRDAAH